MDRKEVQKITVSAIRKAIEKDGSDRTYIESPIANGRTHWTLGEALEAAEKDEELPDSFGINPVSDMAVFIEYCGERGMDWRDMFQSE